MAPIAATPTAAPTLRENWFSDVASPSCERSTPCCTASSSDSIDSPIPQPSRTHRAYSASMRRVGVDHGEADEPGRSSALPATATAGSRCAP